MRLREKLLKLLKTKSQSIVLKYANSLKPCLISFLFIPKMELEIDENERVRRKFNLVYEIRDF